MTCLDHYVGQVLDEKYRLERLLGRGGMGAVYLATHLGTERYVALKLITPQFMRNEEFVARFKREARAAGRLRHPNVVDVTDFGFAHAGGEAVAYLVMEYLDGCTLGDILKEERQLPLEWVVDILEQVSSAVHEAHQQGIVHRDLKPENIWLEPNRLGGYRVKVLDFGLARPPLDRQPITAGPTREPLTDPGAVMGTLAYMSPEQVRGEELDARTDLFSLGAVLYEMTTGRQAFAGTTAGTIHEAILNRTPIPVGRVNPGSPSRLEEVINKALEKDRKLRYQHASELRADLQRVWRGLHVWP